MADQRRWIARLTAAIKARGERVLSRSSRDSGQSPGRLSTTLQPPSPAMSISIRFPTSTSHDAASLQSAIPTTPQGQAAATALDDTPIASDPLLATSTPTTPKPRDAGYIDVKATPEGGATPDAVAAQGPLLFP